MPGPVKRLPRRLIWSSGCLLVMLHIGCGSPISPSIAPIEGKVCCAVVLDTLSRRVVGWSIDSSQTAALVTNALSMAIANRAERSGLVPSMGSIGDCYDCENGDGCLVA